MSALMQALLEDFAHKANTHPRLRSVLQGWQPEFFIEVADAQERFEIGLREGRFEPARLTDAQPSDDALLLRGPHHVLEAVFQGRLSALAAYNNGQLEVYGKTRDQTKLDTIALVVWGV
jgi:hypothetical protein